MSAPDGRSFAPRRDAPFTGRVDELEVLESAARAARSDGAHLVIVTGDPGAGKSRLVAEVCSRLDDDVHLAVGGCVHLSGIPGTQVPFGPFVEALRHLDDVRDPQLRDALERWLSPGGRQPHDEDPASTRSAELLALLNCLSTEAPLVLVLEDLHWADPSSLELLVFLGRNLATASVLLVVTSRPPREGSPVAATVEHLLRLPRVQALPLGPMPEEDVREIVMGCAPEQASADQVARVVARAEGNPLAACELAATLGQPQGPGPWLPPSFAASVRERLRTVSAEARAALEAVAVVGEVAEPHILRAMLMRALPWMERVHYVAALADATETGLLAVHESGYSFRHGLERDAVYTGLGPDERQWWHAQAAAAWVEHGSPTAPGMAARIASHYELARDAEGVRAYSLAAARSAAAMAAFTEATAQFERVLSRWPVSISVPEELGGPGSSVLLEAADAALWAHRPDYCLILARAAVAAASDADEADAARERLAQLIAESGDSASAITICEVALAALNDTAGTAAARILATQANCYMMLFRYAESAKAAQASLACRTEASDVARASAWITLGEVAAMTGDAEEGLRLMEQGRIHAAAHGHDHQLQRAVINSSHVLITMGRYQEAAESTLALIKTSDVVVSRSFLMVNVLEALTHLGQWQRAQALLDDFFSRPHPPFGIVWLRPRIAALHLLRGDRAGAELVLAEARSSVDDVPDPEQTLALNLVSALFALETGETSLARSAIGEVISGVMAIEEDAQPMVEALAIATRIEAEAQRGRPGFDPANVARLRGLLDASRAALHDHQTHLHFETALCSAELDRAEGSDRVFTWKEVCEQALGLRRPYDHAYAQLRLAEAALATRQRTLALQALTEAHGTAVRLGAAPLEELVRRTAQRYRLPVDTTSTATTRVRSASRAAGLGLPAPEPESQRLDFFRDDMEDLTERELEVLRLLPAPLSQRELAASLYVSGNTLKVHLRRIYRKLGVASREDAVRRARTLDLL